MGARRDRAGAAKPRDATALPGDAPWCSAARSPRGRLLLGVGEDRAALRLAVGLGQGRHALALALVLPCAAVAGAGAGAFALALIHAGALHLRSGGLARLGGGSGL